MAHFVEHMLFKGTGRRRAHHIAGRMESVGGELNAYTTKEETFFYATFLGEYFSRAVELLADMLFHSEFSPQLIDREREVILDEINSYQDAPSTLCPGNAGDVAAVLQGADTTVPSSTISAFTDALFFYRQDFFSESG